MTAILSSTEVAEILAFHKHSGSDCSGSGCARCEVAKVLRSHAGLQNQLSEALKEQPRERQMWLNALAVVLANPDDLELIGKEPNDVRDALRPVAELRRQSAGRTNDTPKESCLHDE